MYIWESPGALAASAFQTVLVWRSIYLAAVDQVTSSTDRPGYHCCSQVSWWQMHALTASWHGSWCAYRFCGGWWHSLCICLVQKKVGKLITQMMKMICILAVLCYVTLSIMVISLQKATATGSWKSRNVHRVFKPKTEADTEGLTHDTDAKPKSWSLRQRYCTFQLRWEMRHWDASREPWDQGTRTEATCLVFVL